MSKKDSNNGSKNEEGVDEGRRKFVKNTGLVAGGVVGGSLLGGFFGDIFETEEPPTKSVKEETNKSFREARMFFKRKDDFDVLEAATERIFPKDDNGPGAIELRVPYYIDAQLAGEYGHNVYAYMKGPFKDVNNSNRYETMMNRGDIYIEGLRSMNAYSQKQFDAKFQEASEDEQDKTIQALQDDELKLRGTSSGLFFGLLRQMTIEGAYSDPLYGGNKDMQGWKMREYPGSQPAYINDIESEEFMQDQIDPISLKDYMP